MKKFIGLHGSMNETQIHVLDDERRPTWRGKCRSDPDSIEAAPRQHAHDAAKIGLETGIHDVALDRAHPARPAWFASMRAKRRGRST
jgi:hypothetical protein